MYKKLYSKHAYLFLGIGLFLLFLFFSYLVHKNLFVNFDFSMTVRLQDHISRRFDQFFSFFSMIGQFEIMSIFLAIILLIRRRIVGLLVVFAYGVIHLIELYGKFFVNHKPPPHFLLRTEYPINFPQFYVSTENSYPSGHAARTLFVSLLIVFLVYPNKRLHKEAKFIIYGFLCIFDCIMLVSRAYLGEHWTSDLIGGVLLGSSMAFFAKRYL